MHPQKLAVLILSSVLTSTGTLAQTTPESEEEKLSYTIGVQMVRNLLSQSLPLDRDTFIQGVDDALSERDTQLSDQEMQQVLSDYRQSQMAQQEQSAQNNKEQSLAFLEENRHKDGVRTHPSGLQYKVIEAGDGDNPTATDTVTVHYEGRLIDGTVFDSSYERGEPVSLQLDRVIEGWQIAIPLMSTGAKWQLFIPPELAYGDKAAGPRIKPNSALIFEVELISVN
ncbi:MAG: FKBP-type peptidyl-prolyl cis-trans isomerase [Gammaproteobacteria bacterium]